MKNENHQGRMGIIRRGGSSSGNAEQAARELAEKLGAKDLHAMIFFCSPTFDLDELGGAIRSRFGCPIFGCTTAGEILSPQGYVEDSIVGVGFATPEISFAAAFIPSLEEFAGAPDRLSFPSLPPDPGGGRFALLLIDGLSMLEERVVAAIHQRLRGVPLIGGSAGDGLRFARTSVYHEGKFHSGAGVLVVVSTTLPFEVFKLEHFAPTETKLVITETDAATRTVSEINGLPAATEYARIVGTPVEALSPIVFAAHPVMLRIGGDYYVRSIQRANADGSLTFYCAIEKGLVLTLAVSNDLPEKLSRRLADLADLLPELQLVLGCDCILRRLEIAQRGDLARIAEILAPYPFAGFSTYGEQFGGVHVNHTLTGVAIGAAHEDGR